MDLILSNTNVAPTSQIHAAIILLLQATKIHEVGVTSIGTKLIKSFAKINQMFQKFKEGTHTHTQKAS
jgi:hypothetical protein